jgi:hypothetical protein
VVDADLRQARSSCIPGPHKVGQNGGCGAITRSSFQLLLVRLTAHTPPAVDPVTERIAYDESARMLASQEAVLAGLRARAGTLLAAAALVTAFLAPPALEMRDPATGEIVHHFGPTAWAATGAFVALVVAALVDLWPYRWLFGHSSHTLMDHLLDVDPPATEATVLRHLSYYNDEYHTANGKKITRLFFAFEVGCLLLAAEIGLWLYTLAN